MEASEPTTKNSFNSRLKLISTYTVPKAFSMHETFPKLLGKISKTTWNFQVVLETIHGSFGNIDRPNFSR
jgi:hypothetical protein